MATSATTSVAPRRTWSTSDGQHGGDGDRGRDRGLDEEERQRAQGGDGREEAEPVEGEAGGIRPPRPHACEQRGAGGRAPARRTPTAWSTVAAP